jgi:transporter family-2 protein
LKSVLLIGALAATATGLAIGIQSTLSSRIGPLIGNIRTGLMMNLIGGTLAGMIVVGILLRQGTSILHIPRDALVMLIVAGALGIAIITGIAFSFQRIGVAAGLASLILGQLTVSIIADTTGFGGVEPIPLTPSRMIGAVVMLLAVYLMLPRTT